MGARMPRQLSPRERRFLRNWLGSGLDQVTSYLEACKRPDGTYPCSKETAHVTASRLISKLQSRPALWQTILSAAGLDDLSLAAHLQRMLRAQKTEFYKGEAVANVEDNGTQIRAIELLAELLGHRKNAVELTGALGLKGYVGISPDDWDEPEAPADVPEPEADPEPDGG